MKYVIAFFIVFALATQAALEATSTGRLSVTVTVGGDCILTAPEGLDFGTYSASSNGAPLSVSAQALSIACTQGASGVSIGLDGGEAYSGSHRNLQAGGSQTVAYDIYTDSSYTQEWNQVQTVTYTPTSTQSTPITLYGRILPGQNPAPGQYSDTLTATVNF